MTIFKGFSAGQSNTISIHARFISEVVPMIDDLAELKVSLFSYFALTQKEGQYRYLTRADFANNPELMQGLSVIEDKPETVLDEALNKAVNHGFLLTGVVKLDKKHQKRLYFMNTERGRLALQQLVAGEWQPSENEEIEILPERPSIFKLYEENIGVLTPIIADNLKEAENDYPYHWIVEAITIAVEKNVRNWKYIRAILERWKQEGRSDETTGQTSRRSKEYYTSGRWADIIDS